MLKPLAKDETKRLAEMFENIDNLLSNFEAKNVILGDKNIADILNDYLYNIKAIKLSGTFFEVVLESTGQKDITERYSIVKNSDGKITAFIDPDGNKIQIINAVKE